MSIEEIHEICNKYNITNYVVNDDMSIDVDGSVDLSMKRLVQLPIKFNLVIGSFYCYDNQLTSLSGCPETVGGDFSCADNQLTNLIGAPKEIGSDFSCSYNKLTNLIGSPESVGDDFNCWGNILTNLDGFDTRFKGVFSCISNPIGSMLYDVDYDFIQAFKIYKVIKDGQVNLKRLKYLVHTFDKPIDIDKIKKYYTIV